MSQKSKTVILFGGTSDERLVAVASAQNVAKEMGDSQLWFLARNGKIHECTLDELMSHERPFEREFQPKASASFPSFTEALKRDEIRDCAFFLSLHGGEGEDGTIQKELESAGVAFSGSGSRASAKAYDKSVAKEIVAAAGVKVCPEAEVSGSDPQQTSRILAEMFAKHGALIVKPVTGGSSIGIHFVRAQSEIDEIVAELRKNADIPYLVEPLLKGRELTIGVWDDGEEVRPLPPSEVRVEASHNFDYQGKYLGRGSVEITPAELPAATTEICQQMALVSHKALGCEGYTRTDMMLTDKGPIYLETNTLPGLTKASFIPQQLAAAKVPFRHFLEVQLKLGRQRLQLSKAPAAVEKAKLRGNGH